MNNKTQTAGRSAPAFLKRQFPALLIAAAFVIPALISFAPYYAHTFVLHKLVQAVSLLMQGVVAVFLTPYAATSFPLYVALQCGFWLVVGLIVNHLWRRGLGERAVVLLVFMVNAVFLGLPQAVGAFAPVTSPPITCDNFVSDAAGLRAESYVNRGVVYAFFLFTHDGGQTWEQLHHIITGRPAQCDNLGAFDEEFVWWWENRTLAITHDDGETWQVGQLWNFWEGWDDAYSAWRIYDVRFADAQHGELLYRYVDETTEEHLTLFSDDGGVSWQKSEIDE